MSDRSAADQGPTAEGSAPAPVEAGAGVNAAFLLIVAGRMLRERSETALEEIGLALRHVSALGHLNAEPGLSYSELARRAGITAQSMQATLHQLEQRGAVERGAPPGRGRRARLVVTSHGRDLLGQARATVATLDRSLAGLLGDDAHQRLTALLELVVFDTPS